MKWLIKKKFFIVMSIFAALFTSACVDKDADVDFDTAFKNLGVGGNLPVPIVKLAKSDIGDVVDKVNKKGIDGLDVYFITDQEDYLNDTVATVSFHQKETDKKSKDINFDFGRVMKTLGACKWDSDLSRESNAFFLDLSQNMKDPSWKIAYIDFTNVEIKVTLDLVKSTIVPLSDQSLLVMEIPGWAKKQSISYNELKKTGVWKIPDATFILKVMDDNFSTYNKIKFTFDDGTPIDGKNLKLTVAVDTEPANSDFVAWGWFDLTIAGGDWSHEDVPADIKEKLHVMDGTVLSFRDPRLDCDVTSFIGVPLVFTLKELSYKKKDGAPTTKISREYSFDIPGAIWDKSCPEDPKIPEQSKFQGFRIDKHSNYFTPQDLVTYIDMFTTELKELSIYYTVATKPMPAVTNKDNIQHISKNSKILLDPKAELPMVLKDGSVVFYTDEVEADLSDVDVLANIPESTTATLKLKYKNTLPLNVGAKITFLDATGVEVVKPYTVNDVLGGDVVLECTNINNQPNKTIDELPWKEMFLTFDSIKELKKVRKLGIVAETGIIKGPNSKGFDAFLKGNGIQLHLNAIVDANLTLDQIKDLTK